MAQLHSNQSKCHGTGKTVDCQRTNSGDRKANDANRSRFNHHVAHDSRIVLPVLPAPAPYGPASRQRGPRATSSECIVLNSTGWVYVHLGKVRPIESSTSNGFLLAAETGGDFLRRDRASVFRRPQPATGASTAWPRRRCSGPGSMRNTVCKLDRIKGARPGVVWSTPTTLGPSSRSTPTRFSYHCCPLGDRGVEGKYLDLDTRATVLQVFGRRDG